MPRFAPAPLDATIDPMDLPNDQAIRWVVRRYASLLARDSRPASARKLVQPTGEFFPDSFDGDPGSINLLFWRLQEHSGLTDLECELRFVDDRDSGGHECKCGKGGCKDGGCGDGKEGGCSCGSGGGCGSGGCGTGHKHGEPSLAEVKRLADGAWRVDVRLSDAKSATTLTAALATSLAHVFVVETGGFESWPEAEWMGTCEVAATLLGFGVLIANASYLYAKACKGVSIDKATALEVGDIDCILLATLSSEHDFPGTSFFLHEAIDAGENRRVGERRHELALPVTGHLRGGLQARPLLTSNLPNRKLRS